MSELPWQALSERLSSAITSHGLDLVHPFALDQYNAAVASHERLADFGKAKRLGILIGNTRALWSPLRNALRHEPALLADANPLDAYVESRLAAAVAALGQPAQLHFAHVTQPHALPIQRLAALTGFACLSPSQLAIHRLHGPWFALRAVVVVDVSGPPWPNEPLGALPGEAAAQRAPCLGCSQPCMPALAHALRVSAPPLDTAAIAEHAAEWIAVRDACPVGQASRYSTEQLRYHYTKSRAALAG